MKLNKLIAIIAVLPFLSMANPNGYDEILALYQKSPTNTPVVTPDLPTADQQGVSDTFYNQAIASYSLQKINQIPQIYDPWATDRLYQLTSKLSWAAGRKNLLAVPIINDKSINAFAVPGGLIGVNAGTILSAKNIDELASVLAHEVAHLSLRHYERTNQEKSKLMAMQIGGLLAAIMASQESGDAAAVAMIGSQTLGAETQASTSRSHEREADRVGMQILAKAGFDVRAMPQFFGTLQQKLHLNQTNGYLPSFAQSHPFTMERLSEAQSRSLMYPPVNTATAKAYATQFDLLYWRVQYLSQASEQTLKSAAHTSIGAKLAYVAYLADNKRFDDAKILFDSIDKKDNITQEPLYCITHAHIAYEKTDFKTATSILSACHAVYPERHDLSVYLADSMIFTGQSDKAVVLLDNEVQKYPHDILVHDLRQKAYERLAHSTANTAAKNRHTVYALMAGADKQLWRGQFDKALSLLYQAKSYLTDNTPTDSALLTKIDNKIISVKSYQDFNP